MTEDRHILICDDSIEEIRVLVSMVRSMRYRLSIATNGMDACNRASVLRPDLILLDVRMPVMDGLATCRILKAHEDTRNIPVIFLTAANDLSHRLEGLRCGAVDYIVKPANEEEVLLRVAAHIRRPAEERYFDSRRVPGDTAALVHACIRLREGDVSWTPTADDVCKKLGVGRARLTTVFRDVFGTTFYEWLRERRMQQACEWLTNSSISINTIAASLGFTTSGNFATAFRDRFNVTPRTFRQETQSPGAAHDPDGAHDESDEYVQGGYRLEHPARSERAAA
jgi:DNA-binding response OmpR family regulator